MDRHDLHNARPLKRIIQRHLADPLAMSLLKNSHQDSDTIKVEAHGGELTFALKQSQSNSQASRKPLA